MFNRRTLLARLASLAALPFLPFGGKANAGTFKITALPGSETYTLARGVSVRLVWVKRGVSRSRRLLGGSTFKMPNRDPGTRAYIEYDADSV